jgi:hypothetical protein
MKFSTIASAVAVAAFVTSSAVVLATPDIAHASGKKATHTVSHAHKGGKKGHKIVTGGYG